MKGGSPWPVRVRDSGSEYGHRFAGPIGFGPIMWRLLNLFVAAPFESPADVVFRWSSYVFTLTPVLRGHSRWAIMRFKISLAGARHETHYEERARARGIGAVTDVTRGTDESPKPVGTRGDQLDQGRIHSR